MTNTTLRPSRPTRSIFLYKNGVAYFNACLAELFGKGQYIVTRGSGGYYYFRGEGAHVWSVTSICSPDLDISTQEGRNYVEYEIDDAISQILALHCNNR